MVVLDPARAAPVRTEADANVAHGLPPGVGARLNISLHATSIEALRKTAASLVSASWVTLESRRAIADLLTKAATTDSLMEPFMLLSTSAFRGFTMSPPEALVLDEVLEIAGHTSEVLARGDERVH